MGTAVPVADSVMPESRNDRRKRHCTRTSSPQQHVHPSWLKLGTYDCEDSQQDSKGLLLSEETVMPVADGRNKEYCDWWRDHCSGGDSLGVLSVRLIGDASSPELFTSIAQNDLAYSSKWGCSRVVEHQATGAPINLVLPVLTRPDVVQQAVAGILTGQISLSLMNVGALLVLANAVGFVALETTCINYLCDQAHHMKAEALAHLARLADHLGLFSLLDAAAERLVELPWHHNMVWLIAVLKLPVYRADIEKLNILLHHPQRGAYTELQVLAVLEEQELLPEALRIAPDWTKNVRFLHNIMITDAGSYILPNCNLKLIQKLQVASDSSKEKGQGSVGIFLHAANHSPLCKIVQRFTIFALHPSKPYVRLYKEAMALDCQKGRGWPTYLNDLQQMYPTGYEGPFTIGVWWQAVDDRVTSDGT